MEKEEETLPAKLCVWSNASKTCGQIINVSAVQLHSEGETLS